jgi:hypothetical protein
MERYESKYGEKLEAPDLFVPVEQEKPEAQAPAEPGPPAVEAAPAGQAAAVKAPASDTVAATPSERQSTPALPPKDIKLPEAAPAAMAAKPAAPVKPAAPGAKSASPAAQKPSPAPKPSKPSPINAKSFWKYLWPYWRLPLRDLARYYTPDKKSNITAAMVADIPLWILLMLPRIVFCPIGLAIGILKKRKAKAANGETTEAAVATD